jgi:FkbM family methyltransferase
MTSYAQSLEDVVLMRALSDVAQGFWIDVGAGHPIEHSVTKAFSERGWRGINIEPFSEYFAELVKDRPRDINLELAVSSTEGSIEFFEIAGTGLSTTVQQFAKRVKAFKRRRISVPCSTLSRICTDHVRSDIHFLKVDVEGAEQAVFEGCDFNRFRPWVIVAEATEPLTTKPSFEGWEPILTQADYEFSLFDGLNRFYVARERLELKAALAYPADDYVRVDDHRKIASLEIANRELEQRVVALEAGLANLAESGICAGV